MTLYLGGASPGRAAGLDGAGWWTTPYGRWRLAAESEAMERFPGFSLHRQDSGTLAWGGNLHSTFNPRRRYLVKVTYPNNFPREAPSVTIEKPQLRPGTPHLLFGNQPCLYRHTRGPRDGYDPARTTAATLVAWTALWIHAYETWQATGTWPGKSE